MSRESYPHPINQSLSLLIPVFNVQIQPLLAQVFRACEALAEWEVVVIDDASTILEIHLANEAFCKESNRTKYHRVEKNIGRSAIRNLLASKALYDLLLFLDCDSAIPTNDFVVRYLNVAAENPVMYGGTLYIPEMCKKSVRLHYHIGSMREMIPASERNQNPYKHFTWNNVCIYKSVMLAHPLEARLTTYGHEDTLFAQVLLENKIAIKHLDNPVIHLGLEADVVFLRKTQSAVENMYRLHCMGYPLTQSTLWRTWQKHQLLLDKVPIFVLKMTVRLAIYWLCHIAPSGVVFDVFKLLQLCICFRRTGPITIKN
jgi:glycosyltransferase involved in cell wall biosynthesis